MSRMFLSTGELPVVFHDITPIEQADDSSDVCVIAYSDTFKIAHNYMRAILQAEEFSDRALKLSALCLKQNPANYTIWHYRRKCLSSLRSSSSSFDLELELELTSKFGGPNPKNYQIWYHRRALLEQEIILLNDNNNKDDDIDHEFYNPVYWLENDLEYVSNILLNKDGKNYHAWSHRQWLLLQLQKKVKEEEGDGSSKKSNIIWEKEQSFLEKLLVKDVRNNSAWNQRWFVSHSKTKQPLLPLDDARKEVEYALGHAKLDPYNESPWRYLIGILKEQQRRQEDEGTTTTMELIQYAYQQSMGMKEILTSAGRDPNGCANLNSTLIDLLEFQNTIESLDESIKLCHEMATKHDKIRSKYWTFVRTKELEETKQKLLLEGKEDKTM